MRTSVQLLGFAALLLALDLPPRAQVADPTGQSKAITLVVPFTAGGPSDRIARDLLQAIRGPLGGVDIVIENLAGAGGSTGAYRVARAAADGYSLLLHHVGMATMPTMVRNLPFKVESDFEYLGLINEMPMTVIGKPAMTADSYQEFARLIQRGKDTLTWGHAGVGSASHLCGLLLQSRFKTVMVPVAYKGTAPALADLMDNKLDFMCDQASNTAAAIEGKKVKAYAVTATRRLSAPALRGLPTLHESGLKDFNITIWHGLYAPRGTPPERLRTLNQALKAALKDPEFLRKQEAVGGVVVSDGRLEPEGHRKFVADEIAKWRPVIKSFGAYAD